MGPDQRVLVLYMRLLRQVVCAQSPFSLARIDGSFRRPAEAGVNSPGRRWH
jgi:hypothetical protein